MNKFKGFANYGVLAHEKETVFTACNAASQAVTSDEIEIMLPDGWEIAENQAEELLICGPAGDFLANEILRSRGDKPMLHWYDGQWHTIPLEWNEI